MDNPLNKMDNHMAGTSFAVPAIWAGSFCSAGYWGIGVNHLKKTFPVGTAQRDPGLFDDDIIVLYTFDLIDHDEEGFMYAYKLVSR